MTSFEELIKHINSHRRRNKNQWWTYMATTPGGMEFKIKAYNTWIQRLELGDLTYSNSMDAKVSEFTTFLKEILK